jgi:hypothetical protein
MFDIIYAYIKKTIILGKLTIININMVLYKKLNLCSSPLKGDPIPELMEKKEAFWKQVDNAPVGVYKHLYANDEIEKYISPVLLQQLSLIKLKPALLINFSEYGPTHQTWLHRDLTFIENDWVPLEIGLNWELAPGTTTFNWYKEKHNNCKVSSWPIRDELHCTWPRGFINGVRYFDESELDNIGSVTFDVNTAYLVRTDIPHKVVSESPGGLRKCISVRFFVQDVPTFDKALELFEPFFV